MNTPESTTHSHSYCKWHMKYGCGISVCCECYPDKCEQNREEMVYYVFNKRTNEWLDERIEDILRQIDNKEQKKDELKKLCYELERGILSKVYNIVDLSYGHYLREMKEHEVTSIVDGKLTDPVIHDEKSQCCFWYGLGVIQMGLRKVFDNARLCSYTKRIEIDKEV